MRGTHDGTRTERTRRTVAGHRPGLRRGPRPGGGAHAGRIRVAAPAAVLLALAVLASCTGRDTPAGGAGDAAPADERRSFTVVATGDIIPYPSIIRQARLDAGGKGHDFTDILAGVRPVVASADIALCHMETPYGDEDGPFTGYPLFRSPPQLAEALRATGYDSCSTASNHSLDDGFDGVRRTLDALDEAGVRHAGTARSATEAARPAVLRAGGAEIAHLAYTYGTNGIPIPEERPWAVRLLEPERVIADARAARRAGADVVVVSVHWGTEWQQAPDPTQLRLARELTAARTDGRGDIDLVVGTHNHVPQPYEKVNGTWVVYGLGDQVAGFVPADKRSGNEGSMARFTFAPEPDGEGWTVTRAEFLVGHSDTGPPFRVVRATGENFPEVRERVREAVLSRGAAEDGLTEAR
ncbi:CapA family protein [Streptomyces sp. TRM43335]|uniref:CapA family protein n=1 Tax=Streptomyces taklimakanensis TaxID=2569853 RepID=A0A6G2BIQ9_9ACTN|nr:CapA family protein [Streptomyces taklimakanensis]MTE22130.1 CapA family protein [Streptomyces taklimakanensis]